MSRIEDVRRIGERPRWRRRVRRIFWTSVVVVASFAVLEGAVRLLGLAPRIDLRNGWMEAAPGIPYRPRPSSVVAGRSETDEYDFLHRHNSVGFRDVEHPLRKPPGTFRILGLGDSFTAGWGAAYEETYLRRTEVALNSRAGEHPPVEIVKAGINGYFPTSQRMLLESHGVRYRPDLVLVGFVPNDVFDTHLGLAAIAVSKQGWLTSRDAAEMGRLGVWLYLHSHVARIPLEKLVRGKRRLTAPDDWATTIYRPDDEAERAWREVLGEYDRMRVLAHDAGAAFAIFYVPANPPLTAMHEYPEQRLAAWAAARGVDLISPLDEMRAAMREEKLYWEKDGHCTPAGYRVLAEVLTRELVRRELVP